MPAGAEFFQVDIQNAAAVAKAFEGFKPDAVSHQAAQASVVVSVREPQKDASINIMGSLNEMPYGLDALSRLNLRQHESIAVWLRMREYLDSDLVKKLCRRKR